MKGTELNKERKLDLEERLLVALLLLLLLRERVELAVRRARGLPDEPVRLRSVPVQRDPSERAERGDRKGKCIRTYRRFPQLPKVSIPSSRFARRFASFECSSSERVLTAGIVFCRCAGGADCDTGGGEVDDGPFAYVPCRLNDTGLAV